MRALVSFALVLAFADARAQEPTPAEPPPARPAPEAPEAAEPGEAGEPGEPRADEARPARKHPFAVRVSGKGAPPLILVPGLACGGEVWDATVAHFRERHECHVLTLGGFAGEPAFEGPFLDTVRDGIVAYADEAGLERPVVIGHSIGGFLTYVLALHAPERFGGFVAVDGLPSLAALASPLPIDAAEAKRQGALLARSMAALPREAFLEQQLATLRNWIDDDHLRARAANWGERSDQATVARAMGELWGLDLREPVRSLRGPHLLIAAPVAFGGLDLEGARARYAAQVPPSLTMVEAKRSRHFVMWDEPEWMHERIEEFLATIPETPARER